MDQRGFYSCSKSPSKAPVKKVLVEVKLITMDRVWDDVQIAVVDVPFGVIPLEIDEVYPLAQNESPLKNDLDAIKFVRTYVEGYMVGFTPINDTLQLNNTTGELPSLPYSTTKTIGNSADNNTVLDNSNNDQVYVENSKSNTQSTNSSKNNNTNST